ncbi:NUDIX hydrolase [Terribacillus saccharophilus]|uniref:DNA mismatch repair protein MutT n=1 Tax=Terribacillus saccharophilus TaxID=361277 RepID=A0A268A835_9BACI|nr:NUDIX hydrolase [Terribacillus saccharophilus]PAD20277.1 DNA mismatch repair protein MutT [Terribacillus saccharophilus]
MNNYHCAFGVYAVIHKENELLVIHKGSGPYINRYDLPGGSLESGEGLLEAVIREVKEETGLTAAVKKQIGVVDIKLPWQWKDFTHVHHTAVFYTAEVTGELRVPEQFTGQDALGAEWMPIDDLSITNSSPLVTQAINWLLSSEMPIETIDYPEWEIKETSFQEGDQGIR